MAEEQRRGSGEGDHRTNLISDAERGSPSDEGGAPAPHVPLWLALCVGALPTPVVWFGMWGAENAWVTIGLLEAWWVVSPLVILRAWPTSWRMVRRAAARALEHPARQALMGAALLLVCVGVVTPVLPRAVETVPALRGVGSTAALLGLSDAVAVDAFAAWFSVANPVLEEFFWRLFLYQLLGGDGTGRFWGAARGAPDDETPRRCRRLASSVEPIPTLVTSAVYALYHASVVARFAGPLSVLAAEAFLLCYGVALQLVTANLGVLVSVGAHAGGDIVIALCLTESLWEWMPWFVR